jgi:hypothetical protein
VLTLIAAVALGVRPPPAHLALGRASAPMAIASWCWEGQCGAPLTPSTRVAVVPRGYTVNCILTFQPKHATLTVGGKLVPIVIDGADLMWKAYASGGIALRVDSSAGWIVYVGRLALEHK